MWTDLKKNIAGRIPETTRSKNPFKRHPTTHHTNVRPLFFIIMKENHKNKKVKTRKSNLLKYDKNLFKFCHKLRSRSNYCHQNYFIKTCVTTNTTCENCFRFVGAKSWKISSDKQIRLKNGKKIKIFYILIKHMDAKRIFSTNKVSRCLQMNRLVIIGCKTCVRLKKNSKKIRKMVLKILNFSVNFPKKKINIY